MNKNSKIFAVCGAVALILMDLWVITGLRSADSVSLFEGIMWNMLPCGIFMGAVSLLFAFEVRGRKILAVIASVIFGLTSAIRFFAFGQLIYDRATAEILSEMTYIEKVEVCKLAGYAVLMVGAVLFMVYLIKGTVGKLAYAILGASMLLLIGSWLVSLYNVVNNALFFDGGWQDIVTSMLSGGMFWDVLLMAAYGIVFAGHAGVFDKLGRSEKVKSDK